MVILGIKGTVLALDRATGQELWRTELKGSDFVNVIRSRDHIFASSRGEVTCLDLQTGRILWHNELTGLGRGLVTIAVEEGSTGLAAAAERRRREEQAAAASTGAAVAAAG